jgi:prepilin-type N-terminal cleavage/methylation domain-containing protein
MNSAGFSLLELMMVVCIAGVLMALLLPALSQAKEKSRRSVCNQDMRQVIFALNLYAESDEYDRLPSATDNKGDYHSIRLSSEMFTNLVEGCLEGESNNLYCPNLVYATGTMGGFDPAVGYTIGYSYLAAKTESAGAKGPSLDWIGPVKASETKEVIADANYWSTTPSQALTLAPHTAGGPLVAKALVASASAIIATPSLAGSASATMGANGGNIGFLSGSVYWRPISSMYQYPASADGTCLGNW